MQGHPDVRHSLASTGVRVVLVAVQLRHQRRQVSFHLVSLRVTCGWDFHLCMNICGGFGYAWIYAVVLGEWGFQLCMNVCTGIRWRMGAYFRVAGK